MTCCWTPPCAPPAANCVRLPCSHCRYKIQSRAADCSWSNAGPNPVWVDLTSKPTCTGTAPSLVCSFDIASLADGLYKVEVAGRMLYPKPSPATGNDEAIGSAVSSTTTGDHSTFMREGIIAVGTPGEC